MKTRWLVCFSDRDCGRMLAMTLSEGRNPGSESPCDSGEPAVFELRLPPFRDSCGGFSTWRRAVVYCRDQPEIRGLEDGRFQTVSCGHPFVCASMCGVVEGAE